MLHSCAVTSAVCQAAPPVQSSSRTSAKVLADQRLVTAAPTLLAVLIETKKEMWMQARHQWTLADFKNWAIVQQIDAALTAATGVAR